MIQKFFLSITILLACQVLAAQSNRQQAENSARATLAIMQQQGLIVRIPTNTRKIEGMRAFLDTSSLTTANRVRLEERLQSTVEDTRAEAQQLIGALREFYDIGPLYFVPDTVFSLLHTDNRAGFFVNDELQLDPNIRRPSNFVVLTIGNTDLATTSGAESLILLDRDLQQLLSPLPGATTLNNLGYLFNQILAPDIAQRKRLEGAVKRMSRKLNALLISYEMK